MFSKRAMLVVTIVVLFILSLIALTITGSRQYTSFGSGNISLILVAPVQKATIFSFRFIKKLWFHYFYLSSVAKQNDSLRKALSSVKERENRCIEIEQSNKRFEELLGLYKETQYQFCTAQVIGRDPLQWYKTIVVDKGFKDKVRKGFPVILKEGVAGIVTDVTSSYSKVLLIIDRNCAVDALVQRIRAPGIVSGKSDGICQMKYLLPKYEVQVGDVIVSSGLDSVFPKGLRIGEIAAIENQKSGIFKDVTIRPFVDFDRLEEVLIILNSPVSSNLKNQIESEQ